MRLWRFWICHRWRGVSAVGVAAIAALLAWRIAAGAAATDLIFLGNVHAPRPAGSIPIARMRLSGGSDAHAATARTSAPPITDDSLVDHALDGSVGPQTIADAQATWSAAAIAERQHALLAALNCARLAHGQPALTLDPRLSQVAGEAWLKLIHDRAWSVMDLPGRYDLRGVVALDVTDADSACSAGGLDATAFPTTSAATRAGIAVFPPQASWDMASAVVLIQ